MLLQKSNSTPVDVSKYVAPSLVVHFAPIPKTRLMESCASLPAFRPNLLPVHSYWIMVAYDEEEGYALISGGQPTIPTFAGYCNSGDGINNCALRIFRHKQERDETLIAKVRALAKEQGLDLSILNDVQQEDCQYPGELADPPGDGASEVEGDEVRDGEADACTVDSTEKFNQSFRGTEDAIG